MSNARRAVGSILVYAAALVGCGGGPSAAPPAGMGGSGPGTGGAGPQGGSGPGTGGSGAGGAAGSGTGGSGGNKGTGGSGGGPGGSGGAPPMGGAPGTGGAPAAMECSWPGGYTGPELGKCLPGCPMGADCGVTRSTGGFLTLDDFEGAPGPAAKIDIHWPSQDNRIGSWHSYAAPEANAVMAVAASGGGGSADSKQAIHYNGGAGAHGATLSLSLTCYDASAYDGISFWVKGNAGAGNAQIRLNVQTPVSEPVESGGVCTAGCRKPSGRVTPRRPGWPRYKRAWADRRLPDCGPPPPPLPAKFDPQKMILALSFSQTDAGKGFDFWVDDITFDIDTRPTNTFGDIMTAAAFAEMFKYKMPLPIFTHAGLVAAVMANGGGQLAQT